MSELDGEIVMLVREEALNLHPFADTYSKQMQIAGFPWRISMCKMLDKETTDGTKDTLGLFAHCNWKSESTIWFCNADVTFLIKSHDSTEEDIMWTTDLPMKYGNTSWGSNFLLPWSKLSAYTKDKVLEINAKIEVSSSTAVKPHVDLDFLNSTSPLSDGTLVIEGTDVHINKGLLAWYSPFFHTLFHSDFAEKSKEKIPIQEVTLEHFIKLLKVLYSHCQGINELNIDVLLEMGNKYSITHLMDKCEEFLIASDCKTWDQKMVLADEYNLSRLQDARLRKVKTLQQLADIKESMGDAYEKLSERSKNALLEKFFSLSQKG